jgi:hypothetical protein
MPPHGSGLRCRRWMKNRWQIGCRAAKSPRMAGCLSEHVPVRRRHGRGAKSRIHISNRNHLATCHLLRSPAAAAGDDIEMRGCAGPDECYHFMRRYGTMMR